MSQTSAEIKAKIERMRKEKEERERERKHKEEEAKKKQAKDSASEDLIKKILIMPEKDFKDLGKPLELNKPKTEGQ